MAHDAFISHAHRDKEIAAAICDKLELARVRCWIAPRDISTGEDWTEATRDAIGSSRVVVLVFSENANAAPHIEREIAHAFYSEKIIIAFRLTEALPRRDFLFYLGDVCWFDAFSSPPERHLEALTTRIKGLSPGHAVTCNATKTTAAPNILNSGRGALRIPHSPAQVNFKPVAIVASVAALACVLWFASRPAKQGVSMADINFRSTYSSPGTFADSRPQAEEDKLHSTPRYTFTRLGLWVPVNPGPTPLVQRESQDTTSLMPAAQSATATPSPGSDIDQMAGGQPDVLVTPSGVTAKSAQEGRTQVVDRREGRRRKSRPKRHSARYETSQGFSFARIKSWLNALFHQDVARSKESRNR